MGQGQLECLKRYFHKALLTLSNHPENKMEDNDEQMSENIPISTPQKVSKQMMVLKKKNKAPQAQNGGNPYLVAELQLSPPCEWKEKMGP